jgi:hypothetical protein
MDVHLLGILLVGAAIVFGSYYWAFRGSSASYLTHPLWLGMPRATVVMFCVLQVVAAVGFVAASVSWVAEAPRAGSAGSQLHHRLLIGILLLSSAVWAPAAVGRHHWVVVLSLIATGLCSLLLVAASVEEDRQRWYVILGWLLFSTVTVLSDGVAWNAVYIKGLQRGR